MNTNHTHQVRNATVATVIAFVAYAGTTAPAFATHTHDDAGGGAATTAIPPFAQPIAALDRLTLADYIANHYAGDRRTHTVV